jgi:hypothetical protein
MKRGLLVFLLAGCGYRAVYGNEATRLHVQLGRAVIADAVAADEVLAGAREALAREGSLAQGEGYPRLVIEVLRIDETSEAITSVSAPGGTLPRAASVRRAVLARAWVETSPGTRERDTGDVRSEDLVAVRDAPVADELASLDASRAAARRLGRKLALFALGHPTASEGLGREPAQVPQP